MIAAIAVISIVAAASQITAKNANLNIIPDLAEQCDIVETRLEVFFFIGVVMSSIFFLFFTSLNHSQSFILSEFDLNHVKRQKDLFKTDTLELRFREMNMFNGHCAPFFISLLVKYTT